MNFNNTKIILREGRDYMTPLCIIKGSKIKEFNNIKYFCLIPFGEQTIKEIPVTVKKPSMIFSENYYSATLYKQRNGQYIIKFKITEVEDWIKQGGI